MKTKKPKAKRFFIEDPPHLRDLVRICSGVCERIEAWVRSIDEQSGTAQLWAAMSFSDLELVRSCIAPRH
jgi:hypothetical protein